MRPKASSKVTNVEEPNRAREPLPTMPRTDQQQRPRFTHRSLSPLSFERSSKQLYNKASSDAPPTSSSMKYLLIFLGTLVTLVTLAAIALTIYLLVVVNRTTTTTTTTTTAWPSQCSSYVTITDSTRLLSSPNGTQCDQAVFSSTSTWYRFTGAGGAQIVTSAPLMNQCGTDASGWFANTMPTAGTNVVGTLCYVWLTSNCLWSNSISVTHCGTFYVYGLIAPPTCKLRYCTI